MGRYIATPCLLVKMCMNVCVHVCGSVDSLTALLFPVMAAKLFVW